MTNEGPMATMEALRTSKPPTGKVLTIYLNTGPDRAQGEAYLVAYTDGCRQLRAGLDEDQQALVGRAAAQGQQFLENDFSPGQPGLALFASGDERYFYTVRLPESPVDQMAWENTPWLEPLEEMVDRNGRVAVLLFDAERARLLTIFLGQIEISAEITDAVPRKQATGGWFALSQTRYARHREEHVLRHVQRTVARLVELHRTHPFDRLLLGGPDEALALLQQHLPSVLKRSVAGLVHVELFASEAEVLNVALAAMRPIEEETKSALVHDLLEAVATPYGVLGKEATLRALNEGRVHHLVLTAVHPLSGGVCTGCGRLVAGAGTCPVCGATARAEPDLRERVVSRARETGARVSWLHGRAAEPLAADEGVGAWVRYAI